MGVFDCKQKKNSFISVKRRGAQGLLSSKVVAAYLTLNIDRKLQYHDSNTDEKPFAGKLH